ncbi:CdaR family protein [Agathobaculum sp.]|uniref:CdaR family protein n=1 Tax=Agathobaculum sp. TaxID=2048138 RepID=UPI002A82D978|nr:CdaR family protein [Agathobaculum sp.]MDY3618122.1 CdaR family protein [Agathobaculum sp.]
MRQFMKKHDIFLRLLSLVLAVVLWAIVMSVVDPEKPFSYDDVQVDILGKSELLQKTGLSVIEVSNETVSVRLTGKSSEVTALSADRITTTVDVSGLPAEPGEYDLPVAAQSPRYGVDISRVTPATVHVRVDKVTTATKEIRVHVTGTPAEGYRAGKAKATTEKLTIEGPSADLDEVKYALVTANVDGATSTVQQDCAVTLCNEAGEPITSAHVKSKTDTIRVTVPIYQNKVIPLTVSFKDGAAVKADQARYTINPETVEVSGDQNTIASMTEINLGEIDLGSVKTGTPVSLPIKLPDGVELAAGQPREAEVTITIDGVDTRTIEVTKFVVNDTSEDKDAFVTEVETEKVEIELRGTQQALEEIDPEIFSIGLTIDTASLGEGTHEVKGVVAATSLPVGVTLVDEDVQVVVAIRPAGGISP